MKRCCILYRRGLSLVLRLLSDLGGPEATTATHRSLRVAARTSRSFLLRGLWLIAFAVVSVSAYAAPPDLRKVVAALASGPAPLELAGVSFQVETAELRTGVLRVAEARIELPEGYEPRAVVLRNFSVDGTSGAVIQDRDFSSSGFKTKLPDGSTFVATDLNFDSAAVLRATGSVDTVAYGALRIAGLPVNDAGCDWSSGGSIAGGFGATVHGFALRASSARFSDRGVVVEAGTIRLFGADRQLSGLGLGLAVADSVVAQGEVAGNFLADTGYGAPVTCTDVRIEASGVFADFQVPVAAALSGTAGDIWLFSRARLDPAARLAASALAEGRSISLGGYRAALDGLSFDGARVAARTVAISPPEGFSESALTLVGLEFDGTGLTSAPTVSGDYSYTFSGWTLHYRELLLDDAGLGGAGGLLADWIGTELLTFPSSRILPDGVFVSGTTEAGFSFWRQGREIFAQAATMKRTSGTYEIASPGCSIDLERLGGPVLEFGLVTFDPDGSLASSPTGQGHVSFVAGNAYSVEADSYCIDDEGLWFQGTVGVPWWPESSRLRADGRGILLSGDGYVVASNDGDTVSYSFADYEVQGRGVHFGYDRLAIRENEVAFGDHTIGVGELVFLWNGTLVKRDGAIRSAQLDLSGWRFDAKRIVFYDEGLWAEGFLSLPDTLGGDGVYVDGLVLFPDGTFVSDSAMLRVRTSVGTFGVSLEDAYFNCDGFNVEHAEIDLPESLDGATISIRALTILADGSFEIQNAAIDPFTLWGMTMDFRHLSIGADGVSFEGQLGLPLSLPSALAGRWAEIRRFDVALSGEVRSFDARFAGEFRVPFMDAWSLVVGAVGTTYEDGGPRVVFGESKLIFPMGYYAGEVELLGLEFDPKKGWNYSAFSAPSEIPLYFSGLQFSLEQLTIDDERTVGFGGTVSFPESSGPGFLRGRSARLVRFEIRADGSLGAVDIPLGNLEGGLGDGATLLRLSGGSARLEKYGDASLIVSVDGSFVLGEAAPEALAGMVIPISDYRLEPSGQVVGLSASRPGVNVAVFDGAELADGFLSVTVGEGPGAYAVSLSGPLRLRAPGLPRELREADLAVAAGGEAAMLTAAGKIAPFTALASSRLSFRTSGGLTIEAESLLIGDDGLSLVADAVLPSSYPDGLAGVRFELERCVLGWDGTIRELRGGLGARSVTIAGFPGSIRGLSLAPDGEGRFKVVLDGCEISLPGGFVDTVDGKVAVENAVFDSGDGSFRGSLAALVLTPAACGFALRLEGPSLDLPGRRIVFASAAIATPDFLGRRTIPIPAAALTADGGLVSSGGAIPIGDFRVPGGPDFVAAALRFPADWDRRSLYG